jgi:O-methyltransferase
MFKQIPNKILSKIGLRVSRVRTQVATEFPVDFEPEVVKMIRNARPHTMTSDARLYQLIQCVKYIVQNDIPGDLIECGVWRGGSVLAMIQTLLLLGTKNRTIHLFDTFSSEDILTPAESAIPEDRPFNSSRDQLERDLAGIGFDISVDLSHVKSLMSSTGYPSEKVRYHVGRVEDTLPKFKLPGIALLRLDTDWYASTRLQLETLWDGVSAGGVVIFDDYGFWEGHKLAVDEFLASRQLRPLLSRVDESCRFVIKTV